MKVALIGATGKAGSRVLEELVARGHNVTAMARNVADVVKTDKVTPLQLSGTGEDIASAIAGHDAVVSAVRFVDLDPDVLVPAVLASGVSRYVIVGGAGGLLHSDGVEEVNQPGFPDAVKPNSLRGIHMVDLLNASDPALNWTFIAPPRFFKPGEKTGKFRYGTDHMLMDGDEPTSITYDDMALAIVDELETPKHPRARITIGY